MPATAARREQLEADMTSHTNETLAPRPSLATDRRFDRYARYEDDEGVVVCDRKNPAAWIRTTRLQPVRR